MQRKYYFPNDSTKDGNYVMQNKKKAKSTNTKCSVEFS